MKGWLNIKEFKCNDGTIINLKTINDVKEFLNKYIDENNEYFRVHGFKQSLDNKEFEAQFLNESRNKENITSTLFEAISDYVEDETFDLNFVVNINEKPVGETFYGNDKACIAEIKILNIDQEDKLLRI